ncbi:MAG: MazG nucleotide pyrophosphohydrolase domain-containing protein [Bacillota bacterium]|nr:MazG nucleotide pyrophosphohydrolase domain-containing protein [Bacillota bacterium]
MARTAPAGVLDELSAWRARSPALPGILTTETEPEPALADAVSSIYGAARGGAAVMLLLAASPWHDRLGREIIARRLGGAEGGSDKVDLQVLELPSAGATLSLSDVPLDRLVAIMRRLLAPDGCPWDREQTHDTLGPYLVEEAAEALEAIERRQTHMLTDELGDLLLQIAFHAALGEAQGSFGARDVSLAIERKMMYRHPHVFGYWFAADAGEVLRNWETLKAAEAAAAGGVPGPASGPWRPLRKAAVKVARAAFEVAFAAAQGQRERLAEAAQSLREQAARLRAAAQRTLGGPTRPPEEEQPI